MNCVDCCYNLPGDGHSYCTYEEGECVKISMLEKENAELQQKWLNESYEKAKLIEKWKHNGENIIQECKDIEGAKTYYEHQLIKAKDLIHNLLRVTWGEGWNYSLDWKVKAEQFLKENEKHHYEAEVINGRPTGKAILVDEENYTGEVEVDIIENGVVIGTTKIDRYVSSVFKKQKK